MADSADSPADPSPPAEAKAEDRAESQRRSMVRETEDIEERLASVRRHAKGEVENLEARLAEERRSAEATRAQDREAFEAQLAQAHERAKREVEETALKAAQERQLEQSQLAELRQASGPLITLGLLPGYELEADRTHESRASSSPRGKLQVEGQTLQEVMESILLMAVQASGGNARAKVVKWDSDIEQVQPGILKVVLSHEGLTLPQKLDARKKGQDWERREGELTAEVTALQEALSRTKVALDEARMRGSTSSRYRHAQAQRDVQRMPPPDVFVVQPTETEVSKPEDNADSLLRRRSSRASYAGSYAGDTAGASYSVERVAATDLSHSNISINGLAPQSHHGLSSPESRDGVTELQSGVHQQRWVASLPSDSPEVFASLAAVNERQAAAAGPDERQTQPLLSLVSEEPPVLPLHMQHSRPIPEATNSAPARIVRPNGRRTARLPGGGGDLRTAVSAGLAMSGVAQQARTVAQGPVATHSSPESAVGEKIPATPYRSRRRSPTFRATTGSLVQSSQVAQVPGGTASIIGQKGAKVDLRDTEMTRTPQMSEPPRSPAPSTAPHALGLPPRTAPTRSTAHSRPKQDHAITHAILDSLLSAPEAEEALSMVSGRVPEQDSSSRSLQRAQDEPVAATARTDMRPPPLPPRMRRMLTAGASVGRVGTRAKCWLQAGTHRPGSTVSSTQLYCVLLPDAADMLGEGELDLPQPSGPFSLHEMARMIYSEEVTDSTPVWANDIGSWQRCSDCVARFSWPPPEVDDRSPLAGGRVTDVAHVHERLSPLARAAHGIEAADSPIVAARKLIKSAEQLQVDMSQALRPGPEPEPEPEPEPL
jgi:hypothetical protein